MFKRYQTRETKQDAKEKFFGNFPVTSPPPPPSIPQDAPGAAGSRRPIPRRRRRRKPYRRDFLSKNVMKTYRALAKNDSGLPGTAAIPTCTRILRAATGFCRKTVYNHVKTLEKFGMIRVYVSRSKRWDRLNPNVFILKNFDGTDVNAINTSLYPEKLSFKKNKNKTTRSPRSGESAKLFYEAEPKSETKAKKLELSQPAYSRSGANHDPETKNAWERRAMELAKFRNRHIIQQEWDFRIPGVAFSRRIRNHAYDRESIQRVRDFRDKWRKIAEIREKERIQSLHMQSLARLGIWDGKP